MIERVKASAGSGKTHRLTGRFVDLLLAASEAAPPPSCGRAPAAQGEPGAPGAPAAPGLYGAGDIMAITFTNKAATEMKARVVTALKTLAMQPGPGPEGLRRSRKAARELDLLLRHAGRLNVRTIDSLLSLLLRLFSLDMGLSPDFETVFDNARLFDPLFDRLAARLDARLAPRPDPHPDMTDAGDAGDAGQPGLATLFEKAAEAVMRQGQTGFLIRQAVLERLRRVFDHLAAEGGPPPQADGAAIHQSAARLSAALRTTARTLVEQMEAAGLEPVSHYARLLERVAELPELTEPPDSAYAAKADVADCLKKASRDRAGEALATLHRTFADLPARARQDIPLYAAALDWLPFVSLAGRLLDGLPEMIREEGLLPASLWPARVGQALAGGGGVPDAWCRMGTRLTHLLIDEFQDTSLSQWGVLDLLAAECLSRGGGLFYVGDVKQAIYGWRGGAARLFDTAVPAPGLARLTAVSDQTPPVTRRSSRPGVDFQTRFFGLWAGPGGAREAANERLERAAEKDRGGLARRLTAA